MKISYAICVCNEHEDLERLIVFLRNLKDEEDEINVLVDTKHVTDQVTQVIEEYKDDLSICYRDFEMNFGDHRNYQIERCTGDYIFIIDADELPRDVLIQNIKTILKDSCADHLSIPRINIIPDLTPTQNKIFKFNVNESGWINWPDYQGRIFKNNGIIKYDNNQKLHENLSGMETPKVINANPSLALLHVKYTKRQLKQHNFYESM